MRPARGTLSGAARSKRSRWRRPGSRSERRPRERLRPRTPPTPPGSPRVSGARWRRSVFARPLLRLRRPRPGSVELGDRLGDTLRAEPLPPVRGEEPPSSLRAPLAPRPLEHLEELGSVSQEHRPELPGHVLARPPGVEPSGRRARSELHPEPLAPFEEAHSFGGHRSSSSSNSAKARTARTPAPGSGVRRSG
jgi:hypothetical protein